MSDISKEPLQNRIAATLGVKTAWKMVGADTLGNVLILDSLSWEIRYDYDTRNDGQPVYIGYAPAGTATDTAGWLIHKFTYTNDLVTRRTVTSAVTWDARS